MFPRALYSFSINQHHFLPVLTTQSHNLKTYLASLMHKDGADPKKATYFVGRRFNSGGARRPDYFNSGGAGYALSQATLRAYLENMDDTKHCAAAGRTSMEDVMIARCLSHLGISFTDTRDSQVGAGVDFELLQQFTNFRMPKPATSRGESDFIHSRPDLTCTGRPRDPTSREIGTRTTTPSGGSFKAEIVVRLTASHFTM